MEDLNNIYFNLLKQNVGKQKTPISLYEPNENPNGNAIPYSIAEQSILGEFNVEEYSNIKKQNFGGSVFSLNIIKMQAGLGSSVERFDILEKFAGRSFLGAKGTDLFFDVGGKSKSISELQLLQVSKLENENFIKTITYTNLVNEETKNVVDADWEKKIDGISYDQKFSSSKKLIRGQEIFQQKMPTIGEDGSLTTERMAPAGHGFVGVSELIKVFRSDNPDQLTVIGNGEDLNSTPELPLLQWIVETNTPIVMITTSKTKDDLKGGQISLIKDGDKNYLTIVEKAQAEESNQLNYFEELGLRPIDRKALFNTNVVVINEMALKEKFNLLKDLSLDKFLQEVAPDVICNRKVQGNKIYTQLESALGSVMLNLDTFFRREFSQKIVRIVNVDETERKNFFIPIKNREDYEKLRRDFYVSGRNYRLLCNGVR